MKFIIGQKLDMTQVWQGDQVVGVTRVQAGPCTVVQAKTNEKDGYEAVQIGFGERKEKNIKKPQKGHMKKLGNFHWLREFRVEGGELKTGDKIAVNTFETGDKVLVTGISKGKGFQGVVKRHGFAGQDKTHGTKDQLRMPGSIGATGPAHVFKGQKMPGRMGNERVTTTNLEIIEVDEKNSILSIKGAVPGARNGLVMISGEGELKVTSSQTTDDSKQMDSTSSPQATEKDITKEKEITKIEASKKDTDKKDDIKEVKIDESKKENVVETPEKIKKEVVEAKEKVDKKKEQEDKK